MSTKLTIAAALDVSALGVGAAQANTKAPCGPTHPSRPTVGSPNSSGLEQKYI
jgi:hypothetical protein